MSEVIALRNCKDCIHVDVCRYRTDPGSKDCLCKHSAADVRPVVRGRWVKSHAIVGMDTKTCDVKIGETDRCSVCGEEFVRPIKEYKFCPNCGADMRGGLNNDA